MWKATQYFSAKYLLLFLITSLNINNNGKNIIWGFAQTLPNVASRADGLLGPSLPKFEHQTTTKATPITKNNENGEFPPVIQQLAGGDSIGQLGIRRPTLSSTTTTSPVTTPTPPTITTTGFDGDPFGRQNIHPITKANQTQNKVSSSDNVQNGGQNSNLNGQKRTETMTTASVGQQVAVANQFTSTIPPSGDSANTVNSTALESTRSRVQQNDNNRLKNNTGIFQSAETVQQVFVPHEEATTKRSQNLPGNAHSSNDNQLMGVNGKENNRTKMGEQIEPNTAVFSEGIGGINGIAFSTFGQQNNNISTTIGAPLNNKFSNQTTTKMASSVSEAEWNQSAGVFPLPSPLAPSKGEQQNQQKGNQNGTTFQQHRKGNGNSTLESEMPSPQNAISSTEIEMIGVPSKMPSPIRGRINGTTLDGFATTQKNMIGQHPGEGAHDEDIDLFGNGVMNGRERENRTGFEGRGSQVNRKEQNDAEVDMGGSRKNAENRTDGRNGNEERNKIVDEGEITKLHQNWTRGGHNTWTTNGTMERPVIGTESMVQQSGKGENGTFASATHLAETTANDHGMSTGRNGTRRELAEQLQNWGRNGTELKQEALGKGEVGNSVVQIGGIARNVATMDKEGQGWQNGTSRTSNLNESPTKGHGMEVAQWNRTKGENLERNGCNWTEGKQQAADVEKPTVQIGIGRNGTAVDQEGQRGQNGTLKTTESLTNVQVAQWNGTTGKNLERNGGNVTGGRKEAEGNEEVVQITIGRNGTIGQGRRTEMAASRMSNGTSTTGGEGNGKHGNWPGNGKKEEVESNGTAQNENDDKFVEQMNGGIKLESIKGGEEEKGLWNQTKGIESGGHAAGESAVEGKQPMEVTNQTTSMAGGTEGLAENANQNGGANVPSTTSSIPTIQTTTIAVTTTTQDAVVKKELEKAGAPEVLKQLVPPKPKPLPEPAKQIIESKCAGGKCLEQKPEFKEQRKIVVKQEEEIAQKLNPGKSVQQVAKEVEQRVSKTFQLKKELLKSAGLEDKVEPANNGVFQADLLLTDEQATALIAELERQRAAAQSGGEGVDGHHGRAKRAGNAVFMETSPSQRWPTGTPIQFMFDQSLVDKDRQAVRAALAEIQSKTCLKFVEARTKPAGSHLYYTKIANPTFCGLSYVGRIDPANPVYLSFLCGNEAGIAMHETLHALGFQHEQLRFDRDQFITIQWENVNPQQLDFFAISDVTKFSSYGLRYDYGSIMHYSGTIAAQVAGKKTMSAKLAPTINDPVMGQRKGLSLSDVDALNKIYCSPGCEDKLVYCGIWSTLNLCNPQMWRRGVTHAWIVSNCQKSCNKCGEKLEPVVPSYKPF